jgi:hypothetical protein
MQISHFNALLIFSICVAIVFALTTKESLRERLIYGLLVFLSFVIVALALGWIMYPFPHH